MKIVTHYEKKPISDRSHDWSAVDDSTYGGGENEPIGFGATEAEAIADLQEQLAARHDRSDHFTWKPGDFEIYDDDDAA